MNMSNQARNALLTPYQLGDLSLRNRIVMAPSPAREPKTRVTFRMSSWSNITLSVPALG